mgnify:CR=1 FL=1
MALQEELLAQDYKIDIYAPDFEGDKHATLDFKKTIESENFTINLEVAVRYVFESHEYCEVDYTTLESIEVIDENDIKLEVSEELADLIEAKLYEEWE